eukprot:7667164-Pyramimonas_sp.AAC.1
MMKLATGMGHLRLAKQIWLGCKRRGARVLLGNPLTSKARELTPWLGSEFSGLNDAPVSRGQQPGGLHGRSRQEADAVPDRGHHARRQAQQHQV